jgi:hypothetical protein
MKIEFSVANTDGTNVEVLLIEELGGAEVVADRIWTSEHRGGLHFGEEHGVPVSARGLFQWVEEVWEKPVIGGRYSALHPYWSEREERRKAREAREAE